MIRFLAHGRYGLAWFQGVIGLFGSGAILFEAHQLFLRYHQNEWTGVLVRGVTDCGWEEAVANGDLIGGQTFCNKPVNFVPWVAVYRNHPIEAAAYYGVILVVLILIGLGIVALQRRLGSTRPFGGDQNRFDPSDRQHLR